MLEVFLQNGFHDLHIWIYCYEKKYIIKWKILPMKTKCSR